MWNLKTGRAPLENIPLLHRRGQAQFVKLHVDDELTVDRIFIRDGSKNFDSVTFKGTVKFHGVYHRVRFWVPLMYANQMEVELI